jgi:cell division protein FtsB
MSRTIEKLTEIIKEQEATIEKLKMDNEEKENLIKELVKSG